MRRELFVLAAIILLAALPAAAQKVHVDYDREAITDAVKYEFDQDTENFMVVTKVENKGNDDLLFDLQESLDDGDTDPYILVANSKQRIVPGGVSEPFTAKVKKFVRLRARAIRIGVPNAGNAYGRAELHTERQLISTPLR